MSNLLFVILISSIIFIALVNSKERSALSEQPKEHILKVVEEDWRIPPYDRETSISWSSLKVCQTHIHAHALAYCRTQCQNIQKSNEVYCSIPEKKANITQAEFMKICCPDVVKKFALH